MEADRVKRPELWCTSSTFTVPCPECVCYASSIDISIVNMRTAYELNHFVGWARDVQPSWKITDEGTNYEQLWQRWVNRQSQFKPKTCDEKLYAKTMQSEYTLRTEQYDDEFKNVMTNLRLFQVDDIDASTEDLDERITSIKRLRIWFNVFKRLYPNYCT